jgi:hypothetical protein
VGKNKMVFSNTAKTISSIEDEKPCSRERLASGGNRRTNNFKKEKK